MSDYCTVCEPEEFKILRDIIDYRRGYRPEELQEMMERAKQFAQQRFEGTQEDLERLREELRKRNEQLYSEALDNLEEKEIQEIAQMIAGDEKRQELRDQISLLELESEQPTSEDVRSLLEDLRERGYLKTEMGEFRITSRGAQLLGRGFLRKIMQNLSKRDIGTHTLEEIGHGPTLSRFKRPYEFGDTYDKIDIEKTFMNALGEGRRLNEFDLDNIEIIESLHQNKLNIGIIIDESFSMTRRRGYPHYYGHQDYKKLDAAIETGLALAELMRTNYPQDQLRIFTFSEQVKEIQPWDIPNIQVPMRFTDIRASLRAYRSAVANEQGDKQVYLITDSEPNFEDGWRVGFYQASQGVLEEALRCRKEDITLNIVMLDQSNHLKQFASMVAKQNVGRVIFTSPENLGQAILEDYLTSKRERLLYS